MNIVLEMIEGVGLALTIGLASLLILLGLLMLSRISAWYIAVGLSKTSLVPKQRRDFFNKIRQSEDYQIHYGYIIQVLKQFKADGINSAFIDYHQPSRPVCQFGKFNSESTPSELINSAIPEVAHNKVQPSPTDSLHAKTLPHPENPVNQNGTIPIKREISISLFPLNPSTDSG